MTCLVQSTTKVVCLGIVWSARAQYVGRVSQCGSSSWWASSCSTPRPSRCTTVERWGQGCLIPCSGIWFAKRNKWWMSKLNMDLWAWLVMRYDQEGEKKYSLNLWLLYTNSTRAFWSDELSEDSKRIMLFGSFVFVSVNSIERGIMYWVHSDRKCWVVSGTLQMGHSPVSCFPIFCKLQLSPRLPDLRR